MSGRRAAAVFAGEPGGHRWQRVPPNEKRGRVHTSTVTVAVLPEPSEAELHIDPDDLDESFTRGSGKGGQHRNKKDTVAVLRHVPSGIVVRVDGGRSQSLNRETALALLLARLLAAQRERDAMQRNADRKDQLGCGARGDKVRTIALQRGIVTDHVTGRSMPADRYLRGHLGELRGERTGA
ncbi:MAG TPA: peptide chain release factor-like protein [Nannocystaceae bacterium]|nr:peptide chain release factor-like protein [Nannocystaceae bacterium]